ncbi:MAG: FAD-dependent oxidoreductase, partial [Planctomycetaceae bacterium]|nr:FAD-dependent oxidoreductase [Planctomycetaceae bacterium]
RATGVELQSGNVLDGSLVILGLGVRANTQLAKDAGLTLGATGGILVNEFQQTSDPEIYAAGDVCEYLHGPSNIRMRVPLAGPANRAGRLAGQHAAVGNCQAMAPVQGTAIVRLFELTAAMTGVTVGNAERCGLTVQSVTVIAGQHAGYFPGATPITLKLVFEIGTGRVVGAQAIGKDGVDKRIDVIATAMQFGATVHDLGTLDLAYAPPYGSAKDPVHQAAFTASNHLSGWGLVIDADADLSGMQVIDVRTPGEVERVPLLECDGAVNIQVDELRSRLTELDDTRPTVVTCGVGIRGHVAQQILNQLGFENVRNLSGGATQRTRAIRAKRELS